MAFTKEVEEVSSGLLSVRIFVFLDGTSAAQLVEDVLLLLTSLQLPWREPRR